MLTVYHESLYAKRSTFILTKNRRDRYQHQQVFKSFDEVLALTIRASAADQHVFLLDEERFDFFRYDVYQNCDQPFSYQQLQDIVHDRIERIKREY